MNTQEVIKYARQSDATGKGMSEGYCFNDGEYYCETEEEAKAYVEKMGLNWEEELESIDTEEEWFYYTEWEEIDEDEYFDAEGNRYNSDGNIVVLCHKCEQDTLESHNLCTNCLTQQ